MSDIIKITINGQEIAVSAGTSILEAADSVEIYIPRLCSHPDLPPGKGIEPAKVIYQGDQRIENAMPGEMGKECSLCLVEVEGEKDLVRSCSTEVKEGMLVINTHPSPSCLPNLRTTGGMQPKSMLHQCSRG
jgi:predicted molibdopterin-dependent oxidoreductase YjgC